MKMSLARPGRWCSVELWPRRAGQIGWRGEQRIARPERPAGGAKGNVEPGRVGVRKPSDCPATSSSSSSPSSHPHTILPTSSSMRPPARDTTYIFIFKPYFRAVLPTLIYIFNQLRAVCRQRYQLNLYP
jgi:hypothetical protein